MKKVFVRSNQKLIECVYLDPGKYVTGIVEETDWLTKTIRRVVD